MRLQVNTSWSRPYTAHMHLEAVIIYKDSSWLMQAWQKCHNMNMCLPDCHWKQGNKLTVHPNRIWVVMEYIVVSMYAVILSLTI